MKLKRLYHCLRLSICKDGFSRSKYLKKIYKGRIGNNCFWQPRIMPEEFELIKLHDNVYIASGVTFITHDVIHYMLRNKYSDRFYHIELGCIEIESNVFIGAKSIILPNVHIGKNVIVAAGSVVTKDIPQGVIVAGCPAKVIGQFDNIEEKRRLKVNETLSKSQRFEQCWNDFCSERIN